jgi:hypothetical protein
VARKPKAPVAGDQAAPDGGAPARLPGDIALVCGKDQHGTHILRRRSEEAPLELGLLRPLREGKPIEGEVVSLTQRPETPLLFDVKSELPDPRPRATEDGPAQVATDAYRKGWDAVWGRRRRDQTVN